MDLYVVFGVIGLASLLWAFYLAETGKITTTLHHYTVLNMVGSLLLVIYSIHIKAWIFTTLNVVWFIVAATKFITPYNAPIPHHKCRPRRRE